MFVIAVTFQLFSQFARVLLFPDLNDLQDLKVVKHYCRKKKQTTEFDVQLKLAPSPSRGDRSLQEDAIRRNGAAAS